MLLRSLKLLVTAMVASLVTAATALADGQGHAPIVITSDTGFTSCGCVTSGSGSTSSPYVIGPWSVSNPSGDGIYIDGSKLTKSFEIYNVSANGSSGNGITLKNINTGKTTIVAKVYGGHTSADNNTWGIQVQNSSGVVLDGVGVNPSGPGLASNGFAVANTNNLGGVDLENSSNLTLRGFQMNANGSDTAPNWLTLDPSTAYWGGGALRMFAVTNSTIDHNAASNSSDGHFMLFDSSGNTISNNTAAYPYTTNFVLADGSSNNYVTGNDGHSADYVGLLIADPYPGSATLTQYGASHGNTIVGNNIYNNGPIPSEINAGIAPSFIGGIVVLNGAYGNTIKNNTTNNSYSDDLAWAQAIPSATSPIGIASYPPAVHCNVTAYDGPQPAPPLNGNVWSGNTYKAIDPCLPAQ
jgi:parallel beta-helix repeat protein